MPGTVEALRKIRQYYQDGIINADALNVDQATIESQFGAGRFAGLWSMTDGLQSNRLAGLKRAVSTAALGQVLPFGGPLGSVKPVKTFQADNMIVVNANGGDVDRAMALQDWFSVQENHDLVGLGIEGYGLEGGWRQLRAAQHLQLPPATRSCGGPGSSASPRR